MNLLARLLTRRQLLFALIILPILPFGTRSLVCRSDPIIGLSNGTTLIVGATINGQLEDIQEVHYDVHVPAGVTMVSYASTPLWKETKETYRFFADQPAGKYKVTVTLKVHHGADELVADTSLISPAGATLGYYSKPGDSGKPMTLSFSA